MFGIGLALAFALSAAETPAAAPAPAAEVAKPAKPPKPKMICVEDTPMGSLFSQTICATAEQWEARRLKDQDRLQRSREVPNRQ